jgi:L-2-hydroxyglutarate oxidase LhgO
MTRLAVVGAGIVGLAVARGLLRANPGSSVVVIEREDDVGTHQTGHNSGVIHSGLYYQPGSLKARLCVSGGNMLRSYCAEHAIRVVACGKVVVAVEACELGRLQALYARGLENGVPGLDIVQGAALRELEPHVEGLRAIYSPKTSVVDYKAVTRALAIEIASSGQLWLGTEVASVLPQPSGLVRLELAGNHAGHFDCEFAIVCAGLQSDRVAVRSGADPEPRIVPFRGAYYKLRPSARHLVRGLVYPVPDPAYPFLGIHLTKTVDGEVLVGPNAFLGFSRDNYSSWAFEWPDVRETLTWPGFAHFAMSNWRAGARELSHSLSKRGFAAAVRRYVPELTEEDLEPSVAGIRAQAMRRDGSLVDDFWLDSRDGVLEVRNAPSPAATAAFAIADHICERAGLS